MSITVSKQPILLEAGYTQLSGIYAAPQGSSRGLIVALHGGAVTSRIFADTIPGEASFVDLAASLGYTTLALDRPGYGASSQIAAEHTSFEGQIHILYASLQQAWKEYRADSAGIFLMGHSIGGMIALSLAASQLDLPLLGVSTHGAGLSWQPGAVKMYQSLLADAPFVTMPASRRTVAHEPARLQAANVQLQQDRAPMPMAELQGALTWPERLRQIGGTIQVPVKMTIAEYDNTWSPAPEVLQELSQLFLAAPFVDVRCQRFVGHQFNASLAARAFYLQDLAFLEECRVQAVVAAQGRETAHS